jgi:hypothetical protein
MAMLAILKEISKMQVRPTEGLVPVTKSHTGAHIRGEISRDKSTFDEILYSNQS